MDGSRSKLMPGSCHRCPGADSWSGEKLHSLGRIRSFFGAPAGSLGEGSAGTALPGPMAARSWEPISPTRLW